MSDFGFWATKTGKSVDSNDPRDFVFDSSRKTLLFRRDNRGTALVDFGSVETKTFPHGYNFPPAYFVYVKRNGEEHWEIHHILHALDEVFITSSELSILGQAGDQFRYYIFNQPLIPDVPPSPLEVEKEQFAFLTSIAGKDVNSNNPSDLSANSIWGSFIHLESKLISVEDPGDGDVLEVSVPNPYGYPCAHLVTIEKEGLLIPNVFYASEFPLLEIYKVKMTADQITAYVVRQPDTEFFPTVINFKVHLFNADLSEIV